MAQLVEHHLAKVRVAGSNPVVRSEQVSASSAGSTAPTVEWPRGEATDCKSVYTGSNPVSTSGDWRSLEARFPDTEEVTGSNPVSPTSKTPGQRRLAVPAPPPLSRLLVNLLVYGSH